MEEEQALLSEIAQQLDDDLPRLIYADWLEERGDRDRAEFIRLQCELARLEEEPWNRTEPDEFRLDLIRKRSDQLCAENRYLWSQTWTDLGWSGDSLQFHRGLAEHVNMEVSLFLERSELLSDLGIMTGGQLYSRFPIWSDLFRSRSIQHFRRLCLASQVLQNSEWKALAQSPQMSQLRELRLLSVGDFDAVAGMLAKSPYITHLRTLVLGGSSAQDKPSRSGLTALVNSPILNKVQSLELRTPWIEKVALEALGHSPSLKLLRNLQLSLPASGMVSFFQSADFPQLLTLDLGENRIGDDGAAALSEHLVVPQLKKLVLRSCGIGDQGAIAIANSHQSWNLETLDLRNNPIGEAGKQALRESPALEKCQFLLL